MFTAGIKDSAILLSIALPISVAVGSKWGIETALLSGYLAIMLGAVCFGYTYYENHGAMFLAPDGKAFNRLFSYAMGYGVVFGIPYVTGVIYVSRDHDGLVLLVLSLLAIPLVGMKFIGALALGRFMNRSLD